MMTTGSIQTIVRIDTASPTNRWWDLLAAFFFLAAMITAGSRLAATGWASDISIINYLMILGAVAGLALGQSRFRAFIVALIGMAYGIFFIFWQLGLTLSSSLPWKEKLLEIGNRIVLSIGDLNAGQAVNDSLLFVVILSILFWILSLQSGYVLTRHGNAWWAILPAGFAVLTVQIFDAYVPRREFYLLVYLFFGLALIARMNFLHNQARWKENRIALPLDINLDFIRFGLIAVLLIVSLVWVTPVLARQIPSAVNAVQPVRQAWLELRDELKNAFNSLQSSVVVSTKIYGTNIELGQGNSLTDVPVLIANPPPGTPIGTRFYWRAVVYNEYSGGRWSNEIFTPGSFSPTSEPLASTSYEGRWDTRFEIFPITYISTLLTPGQPTWVSTPSRLYSIKNPDQTIDVAQFRANTPLGNQESYEMQASLSLATIKELREAESDYPDWVVERYLGLPETITPRTLQLADDITSGMENPYDKVVAITNYLRDNIVYQEIIPKFPENQDPVDWFLFDYQRGFCNYYATAEVVLLRAIGIPARLAIGYAEGEQLDDGRYVVRQRDGHAWPEVFFPGYGWVEFEPTVSQREVFRFSGTTSDPDSGESLSQNEIEELRRQELEELEALQRTPISTPAPPVESPPMRNYNGYIRAAVIIILASILLVAWKFRRRFNIPALPIIIETTILKLGLQPPQIIKHWAWQARLPPLSKSYLEVNHALGRLGQKPFPTQTPLERAERLGQLLPPADQAAQQVVNEYQIATFSQQTADYNIARLAGSIIRKLSIKARLINQVKHLHLFKGDKDQLTTRLPGKGIGTKEP